MLFLARVRFLWCWVPLLQLSVIVHMSGVLDVVYLYLFWSFGTGVCAVLVCFYLQPEFGDILHYLNVVQRVHFSATIVVIDVFLILKLV
eukprot:snap_masked-scaffold_11-processed-gene-3.36-mRNA-1 protein AED:1.00 eAED:1.00 QI:0/0/0/0/1/1/4/0/88